MTIAHVQSDKNTADPTATTIAKAYPGAVTAGNLLVAFVFHYTGANTDPETAAVADSVNGAWTIIDPAWESSIQVHTSAWYLKNTAAGTPTVTATFPTSRQFRQIIIAEYSGADKVAPLHKHAVTQTLTFTTGADGTVGPAIVPTVAGCMIVGLAAATSASTIAPGTGFTERQEVPSVVQLQDLLQAVPASITPKWTMGTAAKGSLYSIAFQPPQRVPRSPVVNFQDPGVL